MAQKNWQQLIVALSIALSLKLLQIAANVNIIIRFITYALPWPSFVIYTWISLESTILFENKTR